MDGRARRWQEHNDQRRRIVVDAAIELIEAEGPLVSLQAIGERAGLSRSVVYRHFADRRELDVAVQAQVLESLWEILLPSVQLEGTIRQTVERVIAAYVGWAVAHPQLHQLADADTVSDGERPLQQGLDMISERIGELVVLALSLSGIGPEVMQRAAADPLIHGLVGMVFSTVRRWVHLGETYPSAEELIVSITDAVVVLFGARARSYGLTIDPDIPLEQVVVSPA
ncbi:MAG: TetR/AcrR family transcriptional regulator [Nocardioides sp.]|uniref:TetR/AcrR family transcriptional regulator n=1 Tax=Nocardioides sp. TaxID=35761 RepID=UPI0039E4FF4B